MFSISLTLCPTLLKGSEVLTAMPLGWYKKVTNTNETEYIDDKMGAYGLWDPAAGLPCEMEYPIHTKNRQNALFQDARKIFISLIFSKNSFSLGSNKTKTRLFRILLGMDACKHTV